ncbi:MAG: MoxR family ATPase, partial [Oscillospiraceae bacterium]|nr:MoxR family ATPase [Oscillospiraceae bacterium]
TYPLPEAQMDRFMFKLLVSFPTAEELSKIVNLTQVTMDEQANPVLNAKSLLEMRAVAKEIPVSSEILDYTVKLVEASHPERDDAPEFTKQYVRFGASPRAAQNMITAAKVRALMDGRYNVSFDDIDALAYPVMRHRVKPSFLAITEKIDADTLVYMLLEEINGRNVSSDPKEVAVPRKKRKRLFG